MQNLRTAALLLIPASALIASTLAAQAVTTAALYGTVAGADSAPIAEAVVSVANTATGERWQTATGTRGHFVFEYLSLGGPYILSARAIGYAPVSVPGVFLSLGERRRVDLRLTPAAVELAELRVTGATDPMLNAGRTGPAQTIGDTLISRLPVGKRDFAQLVFLSPQAVLSPFGGVSIAGQSDRLNGVQLDGATNLDLTGFAGGGAGLGTPAAQSGVRTLSVEALQELQILTAPFDVRYGTFAGGLVNAVTRSGSNRWQGSLSAYLEDESLTGKDLSGNRAQDFRTQELALTLGGPIIRDRAAFFLDLGVQRDLVPQSVPGIGSDTVGGADSAGVGIRYASAQRFQRILADSFGVDAGEFKAAPFRQPSGNLFAKITLQPGVNQRLEVSHNFGHGNPVDPGYREPYVQYALTSNGFRAPSTVNATRLAWTMTPGSGVSNELGLAYMRVREKGQAPGHFPEVAVHADSSVLVAGDQTFSTVNFSNQDVWELTDNLSWFHGAHQLTLGTHDELISTTRSTQLQPLGHWGFSSLDSLAAGLPFEYFRTVDNPLRPEGQGADLGINQVGFYMQDRWSVSPRLTLTAGLRMDVPYFTSEPVRNPLVGTELGIDNSRTPSGNLLWSPRMGVNYDLGGRGFLRGGLGLFTGRPAYHWLMAGPYSGTGLDASSLYCGGAEVPAFTLDPANQPATCGSGSVQATPEVRYFDASYRFPRSLRLSLGTDLRLPQGVIGTLDFLYVRSVDQLYLEDVNLIQTGVATGEGNRALYGTFDPATGEPTPNRRSASFGPVIEFRNSSGDRSYIATAQLQKRFAGGSELGLAYTYTDGRDRMSTAADIAQLNLGGTNVVDGSLNRRRLAPSLYSVPHKITAFGAVDLPLGFRFSLFYSGQSGAPYSYLVRGDANADGVTFGSFPLNNDPIYVPRDSTDITLTDPSQWATLDRAIRSKACLRKQRGQLMRRNSCRDSWFTTVNARFSKLFGTMPGQSLEIIADLFNVANLLDSDWGVRRLRDRIALLGLDGHDPANGRGIYRVFSSPETSRDNESTRWRMQLGARYTF
jgi:hypothetical protein